MDLSTIIGIVSGMGCIIFAIAQGSGLATFMHLPSILIVVGGASAATLIYFPLPEVMKMVGIALSRSISCALVALLCFPALSVDTGKLRIICKPGIRLYLDDQIAGITTEQDGGLLAHEVSPGTHKVRGEDFGFIPLEFAVSIRAGETTEVRIGNDGAPMVLIPAGEFQMGSNVENIYKKHSSEKPIHPVYVDAFYMDEYEVTNALYKKFVDANPRWGKDQIEGRYHDGGYLKDWSGN